MPFQSKRQNAWAFATGQPFAKRWAKQTNYAGLPEQKDAGTDAGASLHGPGGLLGTPGLGTARRRKGRKWGMRTKAKQIVGNLYRGDNGKFQAGGASTPAGAKPQRGIVLSKQPKPSARTPIRTAKPKKGGKGSAKKPKKAAQTPEQRQAARNAKQAENRDKVLSSLNIAPDGQHALEALRSGQQPDPSAIARGGFEQAGLVERAQDGSYRLTGSGRAALNAANQGDTGRAGDIVSSARDRTTARGERRQAAADRKKKADAKRAASAAAAAKKPAGGGGGGGSNQGARQAADIARSTRAEAADAARTARTQAATERRSQVEARRQAAVADRQAKQQRVLDRLARQAKGGAKLTQAQRNQLTDAGMADESSGMWRVKETYGGITRSKLDDSVFAGPQRSFPIKTAADVRAAVHSLGRTKHDKDAVKRGIIRRARAIGAVDALPEDWRTKEAGYPDQSQFAGYTMEDWDHDRPKKRPPPAAVEAARRQFDRALGVDTVAQPSFTVFKDASGQPRWIARTTTAYRDREHEILSSDALDRDSQRMTTTRQFGPLRYWHVGQPDPFDLDRPWGPGLDIGDCDYSTLIGRTRVESGTFRDPVVAQKVAAQADQYELSPGFFHPLDQPDSGGVFHAIRTFERSIVPVRYGRASNLFTGMAVKETRMDIAEMEKRFKAAIADLGLTKEQAIEFGQQLVATEKAAAAQGIAFKSDDAPEYPDVVINGIVYKAAAPAPPVEGSPEEEAAESPEEEQAEMDAGETDDGSMTGDYIGDMSWDEFAAKLGQLLAPVLKMQDMMKSMGDMHAELKGMYGGAATKDDARAQELAALKASLADVTAKIAQIEGDQPAVVLPGEVAEALKSHGPTAPESPDEAEYRAALTDANPVRAIAARTMPALYKNTPDGGFVGWTPPPAS